MVLYKDIKEEFKQDMMAIVAFSGDFDGCLGKIKGYNSNNSVEIQIIDKPKLIIK